MTIDEISKIKLEHPEIPGKSLVKQIFSTSFQGIFQELD